MAASFNPQPGWAVLMKFGQSEHLKAFREQGLLYMNPLNYFSRLENDSARSDRFEGSDRIFQPSAIRALTIGQRKGSTIKILPKDFAGPLIVGLGGSANVFCMFAVTEPHDAPLVDPRNLAFGDSFLIVLDTQAFLDRVMAAAVKVGLGCEYRLVEYFDATKYSGDTGPFRKPLQFAHQNEFRIAMRPGSREPLKLATGDISDITTPIEPLARINELVDFGWESARQAGMSIASPAHSEPASADRQKL